jgi:glycosyltransferase involved in cell wall biosynthesis
LEADGHAAVGSVRASAIIPTLDEAAHVATAIAELSWVDEVIVIDGGSTDGTPALAAAAGARVIVLSGKTIAEQRNAGIALARNRWILALDADERATPSLRDALRRLCATETPEHTIYRVRSRNWYLGRELRHGPWGRDWKVRVFTRDHYYAPSRVHEHLATLDDVGTLDASLVHQPYRDLPHHVIKVVNYARWGAQDLRDRGRRATALDLTVRPFWRFWRDYAMLGGWRDGGIGFVAATISAFSSFLKYACLFAMTRTEADEQRAPRRATQAVARAPRAEALLDHRLTE